MATAADIREGDVLAFGGNPCNIGHLIIMLLQQANGGDNDGAWRAVHVGIVVTWMGRLFLAEFLLLRILPWPRGGMRLTPLERRLAEYPHGIVHLPLDGDARARLDSDRLTEITVKSQSFYYNIWGLVFAVLRCFIGWRRPGSYFCSEWVRAALSYALAWNGSRKLLVRRGGRLMFIEARVEPQRYSPWDICRAPVFGDAEVVSA